MIYDAEELSDFEFCPRFPQIDRTFDPPRLPIREAMKEFVRHGIRLLASGAGDDAIDTTVDYFMNQAANPGFEYPEDADPFTLANDHASWLDGALHVIGGMADSSTQVPMLEVGSHNLHIEAWHNGQCDNIFRVSANLGDRLVKWPELALCAITGRDVKIHVLRLPSIRDGRLLSPLCMAYKHPKIENLNYRLRRLYDEPNFKKSWKKIARWEMNPPARWPEWERGIAKDECMPDILEEYTVGPILDVERERIKFDIEHMIEVMERPDLHPRFREACQKCMFTRLCHGDKDSRALFTPSTEGIEKYKNKVLDMRQ